MPEASIILASIIYGVLYGSVLGIVASGLSIIWGVMKVVNLSHGYWAVVGAYTTVVLYKYIQPSIDPLLSPYIAFLLGAVFGGFFYYAALHLVIGKVETMTLKAEMSSLLSTFGFGIAIYGFLFFLIGRGYIGQFESIDWTLGNPPSLEISGIAVRKAQLAAAGMATLIIVLVDLFLKRTTLGMAISAVAQDSRAVSLVGIDPVRVKLATAVISTGLALMAGALFTVAYPSGINPDLEAKLAPLSFVIVVLGGLGSVIGSYIGGIIIGLTYMLTFGITGSDPLALAVTFIMLIVVLVVKPTGLFGR
ncbi:MAG: branched-chain amino acid ABC transporter permease [Desulfurococcales archaeon]|nr:branched-chain amino acid ABC transporter permease [Desulfurococcales archaeon]